MEAPGRVELPTRSLGNCCSIHLSYGAARLSHYLTRKSVFAPPNSRYFPSANSTASLIAYTVPSLPISVGV